MGNSKQGIGEGLGGSPFDVSESQRNNERVNNGKSREVKGQKEFYERRPSPFENQLMKEFNLPNAGEKGLSERSESFDYTGIQRFPLQAETMILEREQIDLIEDHPLGYARCQVHSTYIIAEAKGKLIIVDQHAAHERLIYECLKQKSSIKRQKLLLPETVEIKNQAGMEMIETYKDELFEMGFCVEIQSEDKVTVKEIPIRVKLRK